MLGWGWSLWGWCRPARLRELEESNRLLRMENEFPRGSGLLRADIPVTERCLLIEAEKANFPMMMLRVTLHGLGGGGDRCHQMGVSLVGLDSPHREGWTSKSVAKVGGPAGIEHHRDFVEDYRGGAQGRFAG